jgi:S1-C subfamily serine protease
VKVQIRFLSGARAGHVEVFQKGVLGLGRHPLSDVRFDAERDLDVSSRHAAIVQKGDGFHIKDVGSRNGTFVNGRAVVGEAALADGDVITMGRSGPAVEFHALPDGGAPDPRGAAAPARHPSTAARVALAVARETRRLRRTTKVLLAALVVTAAAFGGLQWRGARERARELARLADRADSLGRAAQALGARLEGELQGLRDALAEARAETERLHAALLAAAGSDPAAVARLRLDLEAAERRQGGLARAAAIDYRAIARANQDAVAMVLVEFSDAARFSGTAFAVDSQGILVTNRHLLAGPDGSRTPRRIGVMFAGSRQNFPAQVLGLAPDADLAVLRVRVAGGVPRVAGLARGEPRAGSAERGDPVALLGYPLGFDLPMNGAAAAPVAEPTLTVGTVSKALAAVLQLDAYGAPGSSGSPVFDRDGRVIGVVFGGPRESQGKIVYAVPAAVVARYLESLGIPLP